MIFSFHTSSKQQREVNSAKKDKLALPKIPSSWPAAGPGKHWTARSGRSCHSSSVCRYAPGEAEEQGDTRKNCQLELKGNDNPPDLGAGGHTNLGMF